MEVPEDDAADATVPVNDTAGEQARPNEHDGLDGRDADGFEPLNEPVEEAQSDGAAGNGHVAHPSGAGGLDEPLDEEVEGEAASGSSAGGAGTGPVRSASSRSLHGASGLYLASANDVGALQRRITDLEAQLALREEEMLAQTRDLTQQAQRHVKTADEMLAVSRERDEARQHVVQLDRALGAVRGRLGAALGAPEDAPLEEVVEEAYRRLLDWNERVRADEGHSAGGHSAGGHSGGGHSAGGPRMPVIAEHGGDASGERGKEEEEEEENHNGEGGNGGGEGGGGGGNGEESKESRELAMVYERLRRQREVARDAEAEAHASRERVAMLTEHIRKLVSHLKHEAAAKTRAMEAAAEADRRFLAMQKRNAAIARRNAEREREMEELREGAKVLEDQLRLMDEKYIELRGRLDWTRAQGRKLVKKAWKEAETIRREWIRAQRSGNLSAPVPSPVRAGRSLMEEDDGTGAPPGSSSASSAVLPTASSSASSVPASSTAVAKLPPAGKPSSSSGASRPPRARGAAAAAPAAASASLPELPSHHPGDASPAERAEQSKAFAFDLGTTTEDYELAMAKLESPKSRSVKFAHAHS